MASMFTRGIRSEVAQDVLGALLAHWSEAAAQALDVDLRRKPLSLGERGWGEGGLGKALGE